jgi:DNA-binding LacI/PurR family transcriptional regulator
MGHTKIAMIGQSEPTDNFYKVFDVRKVGYEEALTAAGIEPRPAWYRTVPRYAISEGYAAAKNLLGDPHNAPTAIFASSDELAVGVLLAAKDLGLNVPADLSIVGVDNHELAEFFGITTINQNVVGQGELMAKTMLELLDNPDHTVPEVTEWPIELIVRSSTARVASAQ